MRASSAGCYRLKVDLVPTARLCLYSDDGLGLIMQPRAEPLPVFHPEFGRFMLEATPGKPWGIEFKELLDVEPNMRLR